MFHVKHLRNRHSGSDISPPDQRVARRGPIVYGKALGLDGAFTSMASQQKQPEAARSTSGSRTVYVLNGPNLNMLGLRQPEIYGRETLADVEAICREAGARLGLNIVFRQSNIEGELVGWIHEARTEAAGIVINAGAYTHTSIALLDALSAAEKPVVEVHLSNVYRRETFRHHSYISQAAKGVICGFGPKGYVLALEALADIV